MKKHAGNVISFFMFELPSIYVNLFLT